MAQLVRAPPCHGGGREFESLLGRSKCESILRNAAVAEQADAQDLKSCGTYTPVPVRFRSAALIKSCKILYMQCLTTFFAKKGVNTNEKGISE